MFFLSHFNTSVESTEVIIFHNKFAIVFEAVLWGVLFSYVSLSEKQDTADILMPPHPMSHVKDGFLCPLQHV